VLRVQYVDCTESFKLQVFSFTFYIFFCDFVNINVLLSHKQHVKSRNNTILIPGSVADRRRAPRRRVTTLAQDHRLETSQMRNRTRPAERIAAVTIGIHGRPISGQTLFAWILRHVNT
jgi:hypothetical protein